MFLMIRTSILWQLPMVRGQKDMRMQGQPRNSRWSTPTCFPQPSPGAVTTPTKLDGRWLH
jgi:hypothetical protein